ncbi:glucosylglycerol hydrolase [Halobaculum lipolyticum]|uniref:Glucosylglycerol hydrolase n=1 Tax=Halobaculum lipolyticum TaxID=3032001 RepID=A0ABD5WHD7_9EURY|nr:glucosylglycerol hydrolase [Halobaculum sp. DT31]
MSQEATGEATYLSEETAALAERHESIRTRHDGEFAAAKALVPELGAHVREGHATVGIWTPGLVEHGVPAEAVELELLTPPADVDPGETEPRAVAFERSVVPTRRAGEVTYAAVEGAVAGTRERLGSLYQLVYDPAEAASDADPAELPGVVGDDGLATLQDPLADSVPFGAFAPAELYDRDRLDDERDDRDYFAALGSDDERVATSEDDGLPRVDPATSMVEIHPGTATERGSLGGLADFVGGIGEKARADEELTAFEETFAGYDAVQLMPVEPLTERSDAAGDWRGLARDGDAATATVARPDKVNWGYDIVVGAFGAPCPSILESGRPDELVDFIAACHTLPDPVKVVFDVALGHADDGGLRILPDRFFHGPGMYGQHLDYLDPMVRAHVLDLQRRKMDWGADGIRVDGAQDFRNYNPETDEMEHDDDFLAEMDAVTQEVAGTEYRPWLIYEDGRPWPRHDWELASTYRTLIEQHPHSFQWSPITFAHNKPAMLTFWASKWWRVREVADMGGNWITGVANHDTVRRGTQVDVPESWEGDPINRYLGDDAPEIIDRAYDNPATNALLHCLLPGVPMDFLNANARGPWGFVRDTDADWNVKVVADEHNLLDWQVREGDYDDDRFFTRLKELGFRTREQLDEFVKALATTVEPTDYDPETMCAMLEPLDPPLDLTPANLDAFADAWMRDVADFANLGHWRDAQDPERTGFARRVREFRQARPWLRESMRLPDAPDDEGPVTADADEATDRFGYRNPANGSVVYYGLRESPDGDERVLFVGNMEGAPTAVTPAALVDADLDPAAFEAALVAPGVETAGDSPAVDEAVEVANGEAVVFVAGE